MSLPQLPDGSRDPSAGFRFPPLPDERPLTSQERPSGVFAGCVMAWVGGVVGFVIGASLLAISSDSPALDSVAPADRGSVASTLHIVGAINAVWCPIVIAVAFFAFKGAKWAALTLVGMAAAYVLLSLFSLVTGSAAQGGVGLIWTAGSAALVYALPSSREWFSAKSAARR